MNLDDLPLFHRHEAYESVKPQLGERQRQVMEVIRRCSEISNADIARHLRIGVNQVTPRVCELRELGLVECAGAAKDPQTGRRVTVWKTA